MSLKLKDLEKHENKLLKLIEHAQKELDAIRLLKNGITIRTGIKPIATVKARVIRGELSKAVRNEIDKLAHDWFTPRTITENIVQSGIRSRDQWSSLRATVSTMLRTMYEENELKRRNIASDEKPIYEYAKEGQEELL